MVRRLHLDPKEINPTLLQEAANAVQTGRLVIIPTDTAYGLTGDPANPKVVTRVLQVKGRSGKLGMPLLAADLDQVYALTTLPSYAEELAAQLWPGALTLIVRTHQEFPEGILGPHQSLAIRIPNHTVTLALIERVGFPIIGTSANISSMPSPRTADAAAAYLGSSVDLLIDAGPTSFQADSTILDCTQQPPQVLRVGAIGIDVLRRWLPTE
jgi:tRNA threonylcarbamoyl adenosine modification protein (Sua5/YciO/YrdC/YwlC family)